MDRVNQAAFSDFGREPAVGHRTSFSAARPTHALALPRLLPRVPGARPWYRVQHTLGLNLVSDVCFYGHFSLATNAHQEPPQVSHVLVQLLHCIPVCQYSRFMCCTAGAQPGGGQLEPLQGGELQLPLSRGSPPAMDAVSSHSAWGFSSARVAVVDW